MIVHIFTEREKQFAEGSENSEIYQNKSSGKQSKFWAPPLLKFYYQHYIIHGKYKNCWLLPACFTFLSGKSFDLYNMMLTQLKIQASEHSLVLNPQTIACDFEKGAIKAFKINFPGNFFTIVIKY